MRFIALAFASLIGSVALAAPPPAPTISVAATDIKQLQFDITPVPTIGWYELWFRALPGAAWVKYAETPGRRPLFRINASVHLLDWQQASYYVKACNPSGCTASNQVGVDGEQLNAMGFIKPTRPGPYQYLGYSIAVSADGTTMASVAIETQLNNQRTPVIQVFRKTTSTSGWRVDGRMPVPINVNDAVSVGYDRLSLSGDGKTLVFSNISDNARTGSVYLFRRQAEGWRPTQRINGSNPNDRFGMVVKLDTTGKTLAIVHDRPGNEERKGTVTFYQDPEDASDQFLLSTTVLAPPFTTASGFCHSMDISDAGHLVRSCYGGTGDAYFTQVLAAMSSAPLQYVETARLPGVDGGDVSIDDAGTRVLVQGAGARVYRRDGPGWVLEGTLDPFQGNAYRSTMSGDGKIIAITFYDDTLIGRGPLFTLTQGSEMSGTVAIYDRRASGWHLRRYVKADTDLYYASGSFGLAVALSQNGHLLAVGSPYDYSSATGIDGDRNSLGQPSGAVWLY